MRLRRAACRVAVATLFGAALLGGVAAAQPDTGFEVSPDPPTVAEPVAFTAQDACADPVTCEWDFGDGATGSGRAVEHVYAAAGPVTASLTVDDPTDEAAAVTTPRKLVVAPANRPPVASVSASPTSPKTGEVVHFDSSASSDPDGDELTRAWDLDGDGQHDDGGEVQPFRSYEDDGPVIVSLEVTDPDGKTDQAGIRLDVANRPPTASIAANPATPLSGTPVTLTAVALDADGTIVSYAWDLDDDGQFDDGTGPTAAHAFPLPGPAVVHVMVTDDDGASSAHELELTVGNREPTATYTYAPNPVVRGEPVTFTATAADPENRLGAVQWDFGGDGTFDAAGLAATLTFPAGKEPLQVDLVVTDQDGGETTASSVITPGNLSPTATFTASAAEPLSGEPVLFTSDAADRDGVVSYAWDLDGDGAFDEGSGPTASKTFAVPGKAVVRLRVTDDDAASVTVEQELLVQPRPGSGTPAPAPVTVPPALLPPPSPGPGPGPGPTAVPPRPMSPFPVVRFAGALTSRGARLTLFTVTAPRGARIAADCRGEGCPRTRARSDGKVKRLRGLQRGFRAGARIELRITKPGRIGKYVRIAIRKGKVPARRDACVWPGSRAPRACP